jgi:hypothetical protein
MKLQISLMPRRPRPDTMTAPTANAGSPDAINSIVNHPGSTITDRSSQVAQFSALSWQDGTTGRCLFRGSESKRIDAHQKYRDESQE